MKREELWKAYCDKNPQFSNEDGDVTLSVRGLRKLFDQTWDMAHDAGVENGKAVQSMKDIAKERGASDNKVDDFLDRVMGKLRG